METVAKQNAFLLRPDIVVRQGRNPLAVADTKWKQLRPHEPNLGVSGPDVYQILTYAHRYQTDQAVLVYPHHPTIGRPGLQREFLTQGPGASRVRLRVVTVDLARLEDVPAQLEAGLIPASGADAA